jgi:hypothetical protein
MGMHDAANLRITAIQRKMRWRVGRGFLLPSTTVTGGDIHHHHILAVITSYSTPEGLITIRPLSIDRADVAPGKRHQLVGGKRQVCRQHLGFELF